MKTLHGAYLALANEYELAVAEEDKKLIEKQLCKFVASDIRRDVLPLTLSKIVFLEKIGVELKKGGLLNDKLKYYFQHKLTNLPYMITLFTMWLHLRGLTNIKHFSPNNDCVVYYEHDTHEKLKKKRFDFNEICIHRMIVRSVNNSPFYSRYSAKPEPIKLSRESIAAKLQARSYKIDVHEVHDVVFKDLKSFILMLLRRVITTLECNKGMFNLICGLYNIYTLTNEVNKHEFISSF